MTATDWRATYARRSRRIMIRRPVPVMVTGWMPALQLGVELERWHQDFLIGQYRGGARPAAAMRPATPIEGARLLAATEEIYRQREAMTGPAPRHDVVAELLARPDLGSQLAGVMGVHLREGLGAYFRTVLRRQ